MGVILYCLLTGTLPFDDDDEMIMKEKVIMGEYEDPEWLSKGQNSSCCLNEPFPNTHPTDARDLIRNILQLDPSKRLTIPQILSSPWFTSSSAPKVDPIVSETPSLTVRTISEVGEGEPCSATTDATFVSASSDISPSAASSDGLQSLFLSQKTPPDQIHSSPSQSTITKGEQATKSGGTGQPDTVIEEDESLPSRQSSMNTARAPPHPARTPVRTKRRSVSSGLSENGVLLDTPVSSMPPQDFASLLKTPTPIIFSTPAERELLNALSAIGFDTAQTVHSVLSDACDAAGAMWWMLVRKHEKRIVDEVRASSTDTIPDVAENSRSKGRKDNGKEEESHHTSRKRTKRGVAVQTDDPGPPPPEFAVVPPTPTANATPRPSTPPRAKSPYLSPSPTTVESSGRSNPSTPSGSARSSDGKDKDPLKLKREGKVRSGSISIMQRATTALEAAGLVRKKSNEVVKEEREKAREQEKKTSGDDPRSSHGSGGSSKLTKSPPVRAKEGPTIPVTQTVDLGAIQGSPWVMAGGRSSSRGSSPTPANSPGDTLTSLPSFNEDGSRNGPHRNRASLLSTLRLWFNEDRKGKRKESVQLSQGTARGLAYSRSTATPSSMPMATQTPKPSMKRRTSDSGRGRRVKRQSVSSRRSSSVNSRRSSGNSAPVFTIDPAHLEQLTTVRTFGAETPSTSELPEHPSRPSSIHSFSLQGKHRKSPSTGSNGSMYYRTSSPLPKLYHRRHGSSSSTRVVRHVPTTPGTSSRPQHNRTNSAASSVHSLASSRPTSFYDASEGEGTRTGSPFKGYSSRYSDDGTPRRGAGTFIAQKRLTPFTSPHSSSTVGRTSWKKSWGTEPPGWQSRSTHLPVEVLVISPPPDIRDVFSSGTRQSLAMGDESDWVDEDEEVPEFAGGLGQMSAGAGPAAGSTTTTTMAGPNGSNSTLEGSPPLVLQPPRSQNAYARGRGAKPRTGRGTSGRSKGGHSPGGRTSPAPPQTEMSETRRWQLPGARGPAFRHAIQEEDEEEEE